VIRHPRSPKSLGLSTDERNLGLFVQSLSFEKMSAFSKREAYAVHRLLASRQYNPLPNETVAWLKELWAIDSAWLALTLSAFEKLGQPSWLRALAQRIWRRDWRTMTLRQRNLAKVSHGPLNLSLEGDPGNTLLYGWSDPEAGGRWTDGREAAIAVEVGACSSDLRVTASVSGMLSESHPSMRIDIWANRRRLPSWQFNLQHPGMQDRVIEIPKSVLQDRFLVLTFVIRHPRSPKSLGLSTDERNLGLFVQSLSFEKKHDDLRKGWSDALVPVRNGGRS
jgi:hypothetical protein